MNDINQQAKPTTVGLVYFTHFNKRSNPPWLAIHRESALSLLSGYSLTDQEKTDVFWLMAGYCRLLDEAGLIFYGQTEAEAISKACGLAPDGSSVAAVSEPLLDDLNCLAHELEHDCNYPFASLRDARGEAYTVKLARLRDQLSAIDAMLDDNREMVHLLGLCHQAVRDVLRFMPARTSGDPFLVLLHKLEESPAIKPLLIR